MTHELITLPFETNALAPIISEETVLLHHGKHLKAYVDSLNNFIKDTPLQKLPLEEIILKAEGSAFNLSGQILNHNLYFTQLSPNGGGNPTGALGEAIIAQWGSFEEFKEEFESNCVSLFGSGWVFLAKDKTNNLRIMKEKNAGTPLTKGMKPILVFDVWEHAYYVDYQNRRAEHVGKLWDIIDWNVINERYTP